MNAGRGGSDSEAANLAFNVRLNERLPKKREIAQGLFRNDAGEILFCQLTYKAHWDLPGGVVDPDESAWECVSREIKEELGLSVEPIRLLAINWLPPWRGWDDATLFLFDLGLLRDTPREPDLLSSEIKAVDWLSIDGARDRVAPYTSAMLEAVERGQGTLFLHGGRPVSGFDPP